MLDYLGYRNKRVIVTGCYSGMGEATARLLVQLGAEVHGLDYKHSKLELASFRNVDLRDSSSIDSAVRFFFSTSSNGRVWAVAGPLTFLP